MAEHVLKVLPPYFDALLDGSKTFEVRKNDRAFQRGDSLVLREWHPEQTDSARPCQYEGCSHRFSAFGHWSESNDTKIRRKVTFVFSGDPRFPGLEPGYVVLACKATS